MNEVQFNCEICNKTCRKPIWEFKRHKHHYCSKKCTNIGRSFFYNTQPIKTCTFCGKKFKVRHSQNKRLHKYGFFCGRKCLGKHKSSVQKGKNNPLSLKLTEFERFFYDRCQTYKYISKKKKVPFNLDYKLLISLYHMQQKRCFYSKILLDISKEPRNPRTLSLDRVIPEKGYTKGNVVFCLDCINMFKSNYKWSELKDIIVGMYKETK